MRDGKALLVLGYRVRPPWWERAWGWIRSEDPYWNRYTPPILCSDPLSVPALVVLLRHPDSSVRWAAARGLRIVGPAAKSAVRDLAKALHDEHGAVRNEAGSALWSIDSKTAERAGVVPPKEIEVNAP